MSFFWGLLAVLVVWGFMTIVRRLGEDRRDGRADGQTGGGRRPGGREKDDGIDYEELERAERDLKDLDATTRPEDGFEGDDWGPGAGPRPPVP